MLMLSLGLFRELGPLLRQPQPRQLVQRAKRRLRLSAAFFRFPEKALCVYLGHGQPDNEQTGTYPADQCGLRTQVPVLPLTDARGIGRGYNPSLGKRTGSSYTRVQGPNASKGSRSDTLLPMGASELLASPFLALAERFATDPAYRQQLTNKKEDV